MALERKSPLKRGGRIKPKARTASERVRIYGTKARIQWVSRLPCWACGYAGVTPRQNAHTESGGLGRKADASSVIALCPPCHGKAHDKGWLAIGMTAESRKRAAAQTQAMWEARNGEDAED